MSQTLNADMLAPLFNKHDVYGPRYTSYPTALQFDKDFGSADYIKQALSSNELPIPRPLSAYIHVPFCKSLCYYCGCNKIITHKQQVADDYLNHLYKEITMHAGYYQNDRLLQQIHFGGGTPNFLKPQQLREVMEVLAQSFHLGLPETLEIGIEIDPRSVSIEEMQDIITMGFNRISIGIQDFDPVVQKAVNRVQSKQQVEALINAARDSHVKSISVDIIYGLPKQTRQSFSRTLDDIISIRPDRIALYNYAHMPQRIPAQRLIDTRDLPDREEKISIFIDSIKRLTNAGYIYIGMDHFALPSDSLAKALNSGGLQRNFQGYSTHAECDVLGFGMSAISRVNDCYSQNVSKISEYKLALSKNELPIAKGLTLTQDDTIRADLIQKIMCEGILNYSEFGQSHDIFFHRYFLKELNSLQDLAADGLLDMCDKGFKVTTKGRLFMRNIAMRFDAYFQLAALQKNQAARYSKTL